MKYANNGLSWRRSHTNLRPQRRYMAPKAAHRPHASVEVSQLTGPLTSVEDRRIILLADVENLRYSARDLCFKVSFRALADKLSRLTSRQSLHAFFSHGSDERPWVRYFEQRGWTAHCNPVQVVQTCRGTERRANSDNLMMFVGGVVVSRSRADVVVIASGDGDLVCDMAKGIKGLPGNREVVTLSLAGSTSWRLNAAKNSIIDDNIEIGRDCLRAIGVYCPEKS